MNQERLMKTILAPHVSEKSSGLAEGANQFVLKVAVDSTKLEIKKAVEAMFEVKVDQVRVVNVKGKVKGRATARTGRRPDWKKAYVKLAAGQNIDLMGAE
ncbi:MAG: 50S ribosomal protein L23 [Gammaproteobacteria bacterium]|nr:50S ribosomal protein L23 [Gammaproteobacteria bacterium]